ncbi:hypothetical protein SNOG_09164 [Parastagonospora nodorum SN15]|uniref:Uncharacterized protein n=1 Tax=Phaeosphaeria nodorum (strain SN15 / ATCC MYA-4574 / FGSC 10173) TaxID=321614 RepID=Q0UGF0_PHANO|nr:hypothetical protein SNOG_09164 [Parastagonospora nodorum SN15]EAT83356.1 hypothetical protein SNOG_09164 [Parastagonospora nodorum SN15]
MLLMQSLKPWATGWFKPMPLSIFIFLTTGTVIKYHRTRRHTRSPHQYGSPHSAAPQYSIQQTSPQAYAPPQPPQTYAPQPPNQFAQPASPQHYPSPLSSSPQYPVQNPTSQGYNAQSQSARHYSYEPASASSYSASNRPQLTQSPHYSVPQPAAYNVHVPSSQHSTPIQQHRPESAHKHDSQRRSSLPLYGVSPYGTPPHPQSYYVADEKYPATSHPGY